MIRDFKVALAVLILALVAASQQAAAEDNPAVLLEETAGHILRQVTTNRDILENDTEALQAIVRVDLLPLMDVRYSSRLILGRAGRGVTPEQLDAFSDAMQELLISRYASGLLEFRSDEQFQVLPLRGELKPKMTRVQTRVRLNTGGQAPVDYVFRKSDAGWKIFDIIFEGISYVTTFRNQISPQVEADGIETVTARLIAGEIELVD